MKSLLISKIFFTFNYGKTINFKINNAFHRLMTFFFGFNITNIVSLYHK